MRASFTAATAPRPEYQNTKYNLRMLKFGKVNKFNRYSPSIGSYLSLNHKRGEVLDYVLAKRLTDIDILFIPNPIKNYSYEN